ncbi:hypothetical protein NC653_006049 [Populus alba x Populus x berolinensis]|uniref:Uncharacterized protein n=1 Tax=Populus alba x Populus x berolinensis TaxID=444605 RepID=A0AAD6RDS5_9ROSI|nr:hypothetical protein NC653_006049 [Populus alba x Populus x berolinensis]
MTAKTSINSQLLTISLQRALANIEAISSSPSAGELHGSFFQPVCFFFRKLYRMAGPGVFLRPSDVEWSTNNCLCFYSFPPNPGMIRRIMAVHNGGNDQREVGGTREDVDL